MQNNYLQNKCGCGNSQFNFLLLPTPFTSFVKIVTPSKEGVFSKLLEQDCNPLQVEESRGRREAWSTYFVLSEIKPKSFN